MKQTNKFQIIVILLLGLGLFFPGIGLVGIILMWFRLSWPKLVKIIISLPYIIWFLIFIFVIIYLFFLRPYQMRGSSMEPTLHNGSYFITKVLHKADTLNHSDIIIFHNQDRAIWIKRIIGLPGEKIKLENGQVYVNDKALLEPYLTDSLTEALPGGAFENGVEREIPPDSYFVLGDNRRYSADSRGWGFIPREDISGKALFCYWNCK